MTSVDPDDDDIRRFVVRRYAYDPARRQRRHQVVAAFDNERESDRFLDHVSDDLARRRAAGTDVDPREHYSRVELEPGYRRRQQNARLLRQATQHGARIAWDSGDLPRSTAMLRRDDPIARQGWWRLRRPPARPL